MISQYTYAKTVSSDRLDFEIRTSLIVSALDHIQTSGPNVLIFFKSPLSESDFSLLSNIVDSHVATPLPQNYVQQVAVLEQTPFAKPDFRTKRDATPSVVTVEPGSFATLDLVLTEERYVSGGEIIYRNAELGDYVTAEIVDSLGVIPAPYRAALCEAWPTVAKYVEKSWIDPQRSSRTVDTYPLNAKIPAGLCLRVTYIAVNLGATRSVVANYHLTKKLI